MLKIRLRQQGRKNRQTYRLVVTDIRSPRDGKYLEMLGWYDPFSVTQSCAVNRDRINYWLGHGAVLSSNVETLIARVDPELMEEIRAKEVKRQQKKVEKKRALKQQAQKT